MFVENKLSFLEIEKQMTNFINKLLKSNFLDQQKQKHLT